MRKYHFLFLIPISIFKMASCLFFFEGVGAGKGALSVHVYKSGVDVANDKVYLDLRPITKMYDHYTADPLENGDLQSDSGDSNSVTLDKILTDAKPVPGVADEVTHDLLNRNYILFVHGWRMQRWERIAFAQTAFKRLWHLGYKGRFGLFSWPTEYTATDNLSLLVNHSNYDDSERKAFVSAKALHALLLNLNSTYNGQVYVFAHSMGNIVTSEALRLEATSEKPHHIVQTYVATQAAVTAQAYDANVPANIYAELNNPLIPNIYAHYPMPGYSDGLPYFGKINLAAVKLVNFYNPTDYALSSHYVWLLDQKLKPNNDYGFGKTGFYRGVLIHKPLNILTEDRYEIFAEAAPAFSEALGAQTNVSIPFTKSEQVDLHQAFGFSDQNTDHSAQFEQDFSRRYEYWKRLITAFGLGKPVPN